MGRSARWRRCSRSERTSCRAGAAATSIGWSTRAMRASPRSCVRRIARHRGWEVRPEVSFSIYGERGIIDLLAGTRSVAPCSSSSSRPRSSTFGELLGRSIERPGWRARSQRRFDWDGRLDVRCTASSPMAGRTGGGSRITWMSSDPRCPTTAGAWPRGSGSRPGAWPGSCSCQTNIPGVLGSRIATRQRVRPARARSLRMFQRSAA